VVAPCLWVGQGIVDKVLYFMEDNPGRHLCGIKRAMDFSMGTVQYQLDKLKKYERSCQLGTVLVNIICCICVNQDVNIHLLSHENM